MKEKKVKNQSSMNVIANYAPETETYVYADEAILKVERILVCEENGKLLTRRVGCTSWGQRDVEQDYFEWDDGVIPVSVDTLSDISSWFCRVKKCYMEEFVDEVKNGFLAWGVKYVLTEQGNKVELSTFCDEFTKEAEETDDDMDDDD